MKKTLLISSLLGTALVLSGCGDERKKPVNDAVDPVTNEEVVENLSASPVIIDPYAENSSAVVGADNNYKDSNVDSLELSDLNNEATGEYKDNKHGLITHETLKDWIDDWSDSPPNNPGTGDPYRHLIILQQGAGPDGAKYIKPSNDKVFTYVESGWLTTRSDGVVRSTSFVPDGPTMDGILEKYEIDPENDMIVCAQGASGPSIYMSQGRCWYTLTYWGVAQENIAVLNGNNAYLKANSELIFSNAAPSPLPEKPKLVKSVAELPNGTKIHATLDDVKKVAQGEDKKSILWDARSLEQYSAGKYGWDEKGKLVEKQYSIDSFQNNAARQSHPNHAVNLEFTNLMNMADGLYHDKATLAGILSGTSTPSKQSFIDDSYLPLSGGIDTSKTIIHYCETSMRAAVTIVATGVILGIESRLFDGAMLEWNSLTAGVNDKYGQPILPKDSPWNTEHISLPEGVYGNDVSIGGSADAIAPRSLEGWAVQLTAEKQAVADEAAKEEGNVGSNSGGGLTLPTNPCGG